MPGLDFSGCTVLITGASGMVGSCAARTILSRWPDARIVALDLNTEKAGSSLKEYLDDPRLTIIGQDICREIEFDGDVDYIIHTAGVTGGSKQHIDMPMRTISISLDGTVNVLEFARRKQVKGFVFTSSLEVYGKLPPEKEYVKETDGGYIDPTNVRSSYPESKRMCECICASYAKQYGVNAVIARLTATFGQGVNYSDGRVFAQFARSVIQGEDIVLRSTGETVRNYCDVRDCVTALMTLLQYGQAGEAYNIANKDTEISIRALAERFIKLFPESGTKLRFDIVEDIGKLGYNGTIRSCLAPDKLMELGWAPEHGLDDMIRSLVSSMKNSRG